MTEVLQKSEKTPHNLPKRASYGVSIVKIFVKTDRVVTEPCCTWHIFLTDVTINHENNSQAFDQIQQKCLRIIEVLWKQDVPGGLNLEVADTSWIWWINLLPPLITKRNDGHNDVMIWNPFPHYWNFLKRIQRSPVDCICKEPTMRITNYELWRPVDVVFLNHNGVIISAMASQITGISTVCSTVGSGANQGKHQSSPSLAGNSPVTGKFPAEKASNAENVFIS